MRAGVVRVQPFLNVTVLHLPWLESITMDKCGRRSQCTNAQNWQVNDCIHRAASQGIGYVLSIDFDEFVMLSSVPHMMALVSSAKEVVTLQSRQQNPGTWANGTLVCHEVPWISAKWLCTRQYGRRKHIVRTTSVWIANIHWVDRCKPKAHECTVGRCRPRPCRVLNLDARNDWMLHNYRGRDRVKVRP